MAISDMNGSRAMKGLPRTPASWNFHVPIGTKIKLKTGDIVVTRGKAFQLGSGKNNAALGCGAGSAAFDAEPKSIWGID